MHQLKNFLSRLEIKDHNGIIISRGSTQYNNFFNFISKFCSAKNRTILYRGSNPEFVYQTQLFDIKSFADKIFMLGEKSHHFEENKALICIDDCSMEVFDFIFERFHKKVCALNFNNPRSRDKVKSFLDENNLIKEYFTNMDNKENFISIVSTKKDSEKRYILDYYFSLLHAIGKSVNKNSYFISTSKNIKIAKQFKDDGIIVITWVPASERNNQIIKYTDLNKLDDYIKNVKLPYYYTSPYSEQDEVCIKGGILPHYIVGYVHNECFIINPNLLASFLNNFERSLNDGIYIDQTNFNNILQKTKYKRGFRCIDGDYYESQQQ